VNLPRLVSLVVVALVLLSCASREPLPAKSGAVPAGIDLSGRWQLRDDSREISRAISEIEREAAGADEGLIPESRRKRSSRKKNDDTQVHVFLEFGEALKITQVERGLFVSFDRSIVEEYRFGEQRMANVGPVVADRVSGWENDGYVIETRDKEGEMLIETYRLEGKDVMIRTIRIIHNDKPKLDVRQVFDRVQ
jgi:hypothetical protein